MINFHFFGTQYFFVFLLLKAYAVTAIMKICAFEISAGRKVELLPEVGCF